LSAFHFERVHASGSWWVRLGWQWWQAHAGVLAGQACSAKARGRNAQSTIDLLYNLYAVPQANRQFLMAVVPAQAFWCGHFVVCI